MDFVLVFAVLGLVVLIIFKLTRSMHSSDEERFSQAGVSVNYNEKTIEFAGNTYAVSKIRGVRWESGLGKNGNHSYAYIKVDDMRRPVHQIHFVTRGAAEVFCQRLQLALEKTGEASFE